MTAPQETNETNSSHSHDHEHKSTRGWLPSFFGSCASCGGSATSSATLSSIALSHIPCCVILPIFTSAVSGSTVSSAMQTATYVASPVIAGGIALGIEKFQKRKALSKSSLTKAGISAGLALAMTFGINALTGDSKDHIHSHDHDHISGSEHHEHHDCGDACTHDVIILEGDWSPLPINPLEENQTHQDEHNHDCSDSCEHHLH